MKFDFEKWKDKNVCMYCQTEEEMIDFCKEMDSAGLRWCTGDRYTEPNPFICAPIVYYFNDGTHNTIYSEDDIVPKTIVLKWSDYMKEKSLQKMSGNINKKEEKDMITKYLYIGGYNGFFIETIQEAFSRFGWENHIAEDGYLEYSFPKTDVPFWEKVIEYIIP